MNAGSNGGWTLVKVGSGTQTLSGTVDNNSGRANVTAGTLVLAKSSTSGVHALGSGLTIAGGTAQLGGTGGDQIYDNVVVTLNSGSFDLNGRTETIKGLIGSGGAVGNTSGTQAVLTINHSTISNSGTREYSGAVNGNVRVVLANSANKNSDVQTFAGTNGYTGGTLIDNGHLRVTSDAGLGAVPGSFDAANITLQNGGVLQNNNSDPVLHANRGITLGTGGGVIYAGWSKTVTVNGAITGSGNLTKTDGGALILSSTSNNYTGQTLVQQGEIRLAASNVLPNATELVMSGGTVNLNGFTDTVAALSGSSGTVTGGAGTSLTVLTTGTKTFTGTVGNAMAFTMNGSGTQTLTGTLIDYTGATTISAGTLKFQDLDDLHSSGLSIASGTTAEFSNSVRNFNRFTNTSITGTGTFVKTGTSTLTTGNSGGYARFNMTGGTIDVQQGTIVADYQDTNATLAWGSNKASMNVASGATVSMVGGNHIMVDALTGAGTVQNINSWGTGIFTVGQNNGGGTFSGILRDNGGPLALTKNGSGTQILTGANTYTQTTTINGGVLQIGDGGTTGTLGTGGVTNNATLRFNRSNAVTVANAIGGTGALVQAGTGTLTLTNAGNTYTGATTINAGTLEIGGGGRLNNGAYAGAISNSGTLLYNSTAAQTLSGAMSGAGALVKANTGSLTLSGSSGGYSGPVTIRAGTLQVSSGNGAGTNTITLGDGSTGASSTTLNAGANFGNAIVIAAGPTGAAAINAAVTTPVLSGSLAVNRDVSMAGGSDRMTWTGAGANWTGSGNITVTSGRVTHDTASGNTWSGNMTINSGATFQPGQASTLRSVNSVTANGTLQLNNVAQTINGLSGSGTVQNIVGGNTLTIGAGNATSTFSGVIQNGSGTMTIVKSGTGTLTLTGTSTYTGNTTINAGTFEMGGAGRLGSGSYAGNITNNGTLQVNSTAAQTLSGTMTGAGSLVKNNTGVLTLSTPKTYTGATTVSGGTLTVNSTGTLSGTTGLSLASGATFNYLPATIGSAMTMGAGSTLDLSSNSILGLNWDATTASKIVAAGAATVGSNVKVSMTGAYTSGQAYTILQAGSGLGSGSYTAINNVDYTAAFVQSPTSVTITPTTVAPLAAAYWKGGTSGYDSVLGVASNWTTDGAGTVSGLTPGAAADVYFSDSGAAAGNQINMTMGANMALNSITVNGTLGSPVNTNPVSLSATGGYTLTLGSTTGAGITMNPGAGALTLNPPLTLGAAQTWTNNSGNALTVNGVVSGSSALTKAGSGPLNLNGANTFTGALNVNAGRVTLGNSAGLGVASAVTIASGAALNVAGFNASRPITVSGTGDGSIAAIYNSSTGSGSSLGAVTLAGNATLGGASSGNSVSFGMASLDLAGYTLTMETARLSPGGMNITAGNIVANNNSVIYQSNNPASTTHTYTFNSGSILEIRDSNNTGVANVAPITLNGGTISTGGPNSPQGSGNGGGAASNWKNNITIGASGGTIYGNNTGFGHWLTLSGPVTGSGQLTTSGGAGVSLAGTISGFTGNLVNSTNLGFNYATDQTLSGNLTSTGGITKSGAGILTLNGTNTQSSNTLISGGTLRIGASASYAAGGYIIANAGTILDVNGTASISGGGYLQTSSGAGTGTININSGAVFTHNGTGGMIIGQNVAGHNGVLNVSGTFTQNANNAIFGNNQPGATGTLNVNSGGTVTFGAGMSAPGASGGGAIAGVVLGRDNATAVGTFNLNAGGLLESAKGMIRGTGQGYFNFNGGTLRALGSTTAFLDVTTTTVNSGGAVVDSNGFDVTIVDGLTAGTGSGGLTKNGAGVLTLAGANTYTGVTAVNAGALTISGAGTLAGTSAVNVADGAQFNYSPASPGTLSLAGATLSLASGSTFGTTWGSTIAAAGTATVGGSDVGIEMLSGSFTSGTPYTVLTAASGLTSGAYVLRNNYNYIATIDSSSGTSVILTPTAVAALTTAYWKGGLSGQVNVWAASDGSSTSNWVGTSGGPDQPLTPGAGADVIVSNSTLNTAPTSTVLGANMSIKSLTISDTNNGLGLNADGYKLTITPASSSAGISVSAGVPASSIGANIGLGANQTWTNNSSNPFTVSGALSGSGNLTISGTAPVVLSGTSVNTGGVVVSGGTLSVSSISTSGASNIGNEGGANNYFGMVNGTLRYTGGGAQTTTHRLWIDQAQTGSTFDITNPAGALTWNPGGGTVNKNITKTGPGSLTLGGTVNGTMAVAVNQGTLTFTGNAIDYTGATTVSGGRLVLYNNDDTWTSGLNISSGATVELYRDNSTPYEHRAAFTLSGAGTLEKTGNGAASMSWDQGGTVAMASGGLIHVKAGTLRLEYGAQSNWASNLSDLTVDSGATFDLWDNNNAGVFVDSLNGAGTITRTSFAQTSTLTIGVDNGGGTFSGSIANAVGVINLTKTGSGTQTLSGNNTYSGTTTISNGLLIASGGNGIGDGSVVSLPNSATAALHINNTEEVGLLSGGGASGGNITLANGITLSTGNQGGSASYDGVISGTGASLQKRGGGNQTLTGNNSFTGGVTIQNGTLTVPSIAATGVNQPLGAGTTPIVFSGASGTLAITGSGTTSRGLTLSTGSSTLSVGGTVTLTGDITGGDSGSTFTKAGAGTFNYSGTGSWNAGFNVTGGAFELSGAGSIPSAGVTSLSGGASLRINTTGVMQTSRITVATGTTVNLEAGTLRVAGGDLGGSPVYSIDNSGSFAWGTGTTLAVVGGKASGQTDRTALAGAASGPAIKEGNYLFVKNDLTQPTGSTLDLGGLYGSSDSLRYNQIHVTGSLTIDDGASLKLDLNPYYLRPFGANERFTGDWGTLVLAYATGGITGDYDFANILGITSDRIGWTRLADETDSFLDPADLDLDTYVIEYRTGAGAGFNFVQAGGAILLHYKVSGSVPEPGSASLLIAGIALIRTLRRRK